MTTYCEFCGTKQIETSKERSYKPYNPLTGEKIIDTYHYCPNLKCEKGCQSNGGHFFEGSLLWIEIFGGCRKCSRCGTNEYIERRC